MQSVFRPTYRHHHLSARFPAQDGSRLPSNGATPSSRAGGPETAKQPDHRQARGSLQGGGGRGWGAINAGSMEGWRRPAKARGPGSSGLRVLTQQATACPVLRSQRCQTGDFLQRCPAKAQAIEHRLGAITRQLLPQQPALRGWEMPEPMNMPSRSGQQRLAQLSGPGDASPIRQWPHEYH